MEMAGQSVTAEGEVTYITTAVKPAAGVAGSVGIATSTMVDIQARGACAGIMPTPPVLFVSMF